MTMSGRASSIRLASSCGAKPPKYDRMNRTDTRAREHGHHSLRHVTITPPTTLNKIHDHVTGLGVVVQAANAGTLNGSRSHSLPKLLNLSYFS